MRVTGTLAAAMVGYLGAVSTPAWAHHSAAMFDESQQMELHGTVREFQYTNPHSWIQLVVTDQTGAATEWSIQLGAPAGLFRMGWKPHVLKPGDKITVVLHPMKDRTNAGEFISASRDDGQPIVQ